MTLVYRAPKLPPNKIEDTPGPAAYSHPFPQTPAHPSPCFQSKLKRQLVFGQQEPHVGPGSYQLQQTLHKKQNGSVVFQSKIKRFEQDKPEPEQSRIKLDFQVKQGEAKEKSTYKVPGKLMNTRQRKQLQKQLVIPQRLPSIPANEHSYGYRFDPTSNKLVYNDSPKIMFAKKSLQEGQDYYFQRIKTTLDKKQVCSFKSKVERPSPELKHQVQVPNATHYHPQLYHSIGHLRHSRGQTSNSNLAKLDGNNSLSIKEKLLLGQLKNQFKQFISEEIDISELQKEKQRQLEERSPTKKQEDKKEFFMSKEKRFAQVRKSTSQQVISNNSSIRLGQIRRIKSNTEEEDKPRKIKEPFAQGEQRFKERAKQNLGPGSYNYESQPRNGVSLVKNQQRFKTTEAIDTPGPGAYDTESHPKPQRERVPFSKFVCAKTKETGQSKFSSMQDLYQQVGRHLNFIQKSEKESQRAKHSSQEAFRKENQSKLKLQQMTKAKISEKIGNSPNSNQIEPRQPRKVSKPRYIHLYDYQRPCREQSLTGPGYYEIRTTLQKKSFNKMPPPQYI